MLGRRASVVWRFRRRWDELELRWVREHRLGNERPAQVDEPRAGLSAADPMAPWCSIWLGLPGGVHFDSATRNVRCRPRPISTAASKLKIAVRGRRTFLHRRLVGQWRHGARSGWAYRAGCISTAPRETYGVGRDRSLRCVGSAAARAGRRPVVGGHAGRGVNWLIPVVQIGAAVAALGSLLALILGVSRTTVGAVLGPQRLARAAAPLSEAMRVAG